MPYNLEYHKQMNRSHILPNMLSGARAGVYTQFLSDVILSLLLFNENIVVKDIRISEISSYYAAIASGMVASVLYIYMDPFAVVLFSITTYAFVFNLVSSKINNTEFRLRPREIIFDAGVSILLLYAFDPTAHSQYLRYTQKRHLIEPTIPRSDRTSFQSVFFIVLVSTYGFLKTQDNTNNTSENNN